MLSWIQFITPYEAIITCDQYQPLLLMILSSLYAHPNPSLFTTLSTAKYTFPVYFAVYTTLSPYATPAHLLHTRHTHISYLSYSSYSSYISYLSYQYYSSYFTYLSYLSYSSYLSYQYHSSYFTYLSYLSYSSHITYSPYPTYSLKHPPHCRYIHPSY